MRIIALCTSRELTHALLKHLVETEKHKVEALFIDHDGADEPWELCQSLGVKLHRVELHDYVGELRADGDNRAIWRTENLVGIMLAGGMADSRGMDAVAVPFTRESGGITQDHHPGPLSLVEGMFSMLISPILYRPFESMAKAEVLERYPLAKDHPPLLCFRMLRCPDKRETTTTIPSKVTCPSCIDMMVPMKAEQENASEPEPEPDEAEELDPKTIPEMPRYDGPLRPFIFSAEGVYGYVNDKTSFEQVVNQMGSAQSLLDSCMVLPAGSGAPTFSPDGQGDSLEDWIGSAIDTLIETSHLTTPGGGHNPGHVGCC